MTSRLLAGTLLLMATVCASCASSPPRPSTAEILDFGPEFSPDGSSVVFSSDRSGTHKIYVVDLDTLEVMRVTDGRSRDLYPAWSADGSTIAYVAHDPTADPPVVSALSVITLTGEPLEVVTSGAIEAFPHVNDADEVVMACGAEQYDICLRNLDLTLAALIVADPEAREWHPAWSPDAARVAYTSDAAGNDDIWTIDMNTGTTDRLTGLSVAETEPAWSPDGSLIAYTRRGENPLDPAEVWVMTSTGRDQRVVTEGSSPSWSPDGSQLAIAARPDLPERGIVIKLVDLDSGVETQISR